MQENGSAGTAAPVDEKAAKYQEFLQKCCEVGQILFQLDRLNSQKLQMEKELDLAQRAAKSAAHKHDELNKKDLETLKLKTSVEKAIESVTEPVEQVAQH